MAELEAKQQRKEGNLFIADGDVDLRYQELRIRADHMEYNAETAEALARGHVQFDFDNQHLDAEEAHYNVHSRRGSFSGVRGSVKIDRRPNPTVLITENPLYFEAQQVERLDDRTYVIHKVWLTVCEPGRPKWKFYAPRATLHLDQKVALVNANFRVYRVPLFYLPYATAPAGRHLRQSGFLVPDVGNSSQKGTILGDLFYWAPLDWMDTTFGAQYFSKRGWSQIGELRIRPWENARLNYTYFGVDDRGLPGPTGVRVPQGGHQQQLEAETLLARGWRAVADFNQLSSLTFRQAFANSFAEAVNTEERSAFFLTNHFRGFSLNFAAVDDKNFLTSQPATFVVLQSVPEMRFNSVEQAPWDRLPVYFGFDAYAGALHREDADLDTPLFVQRSEFSPRVTVPLRWGPWLGVTTTAAFRTTRYGSELVNGAVAGQSISRNTGEFTADFRPPAFERVWEDSDTKWKHTVEPDITYNYVTGVENFSRFIRFDQDDTLTNTSELEYGITQRLFRKQNDAQPEELFTWRLAQKHYFDPTFGGALATGQRNVFAALDSITPFAFADRPTHWSPLVSDLKFTPGGPYDAELIVDYDNQRNRVTTIGTLIKAKPYRQFFATVAHFRLKSNPVLQPRSNQLRMLAGYGDINRKGFNLSGGFSYDLTQRITQNKLVQVSYNGGCCGVAFEYRRFNLGTVTTGNQFRVAFVIANIGTFGNLRRQEKIF
ncbi:MAG TPA: LPS assembly protein LptD [Candidatus Acidoferrales bacterium]|nr:LPS assembly protein LptD [Candidatus Acidoferrales bacterium]